MAPLLEGPAPARPRKLIAQWKAKKSILAALGRESVDIARDGISFLGSLTIRAVTQIYANRVDVAFAAILGLMASAYAIWSFYQLSFIHLASLWDLWFDADVRRIVGANSSRFDLEHYRTKVHPLYALASVPFIFLTKLGFSPQSVSAIHVAVSAFAFTSVFFAATRTLGLQRLDAVLFTVLMLSTSTSTFWLPVPETYVLGVTTMLLSMCWLGAPRGEHDRLTGPLQSIASLSITITNWMAGLLAAVLALGVRRGIHVSAIGFAIVVVMSGIQLQFFPSSGRLFDFAEEQLYVNQDQGQSPAARLTSYFGQSLIAPEVVVAPVPLMKVHGLTFATAFPQLLSPVTLLAFAGWTVLIVVGVATSLTKGAKQRLVLFLLSVLAGQLILHMVYGPRVFLYAMHFAPLIVLVAANAALCPWRNAIRAIAIITAISSLSHNAIRFQDAAQMLPSLAIDQQWVDKYLK